MAQSDIKVSCLQDKGAEINIVSDGGVHNYNSNFGMVIAIKLKAVAMNIGKTYSVAFHKSSYHSEIYGVLAGIVSIRYIIKKTSLGSG
jgi:hypothetical protein